MIVSGKVCFELEPPQHREDALDFLIQDVMLMTPSTVLDLKISEAVRIAAIRTVQGGSLSGAMDTVVDVRTAHDLTVYAKPEATVRFECELDRLAECRPLELKIGGLGTFQIQTEIEHLHCVGDRFVGPWLDVPESGRVFEVTGDVRIRSVEGLLAGRPGRRQQRISPWSTASESSRSPLIHDIDGAAERSEGLVVNVDPTGIPYHHLDNAESFQVFEPDSVALIDFTRWHPDSNDASHAARRKAYQAQKIAEMVAGSAASGGARSAASWTAARAHHQALTGAPGERALRTVHRWLGYSQRPGPPLITYLSVVLIWTQVQWCQLEPRPGRGIGGWMGSFWHMALLPASAVSRLPEKGGDFEYLFDNLGWHTIAFVTMGVPLIFFFISLRHFLAAPSKK